MFSFCKRCVCNCDGIDPSVAITCVCRRLYIVTIERKLKKTKGLTKIVMNDKNSNIRTTSKTS